MKLPVCASFRKYRAFTFIGIQIKPARSQKWNGPIPLWAYRLSGGSFLSAFRNIPCI